jgi:hypothetical protein
MSKGYKKYSNRQGPVGKTRGRPAIIRTSKTVWFILILIILCLCPTSCARELPQYVAPGEILTLTAPPGYTYYWIKYDASGHGTIAGKDQTCTIDVPNDALTGDIFSAVVTLTEAHTGGGNPSCIGYLIIYLQVRQFTCPILDDFCYQAAQPADAAKFEYDNFPAGEGFTYVWSGNGLDGTKLSGPQSDIQTYLNTMNEGQYTATFTVKHGTRTAWTCSDDFAVYALPTGAINIPQ